MSAYTAASLFSGAGGLDLGFEGRFRLKLANDIRKSAAETYSRNFEVPVIDVRSYKKGLQGVYLLGDVKDMDLGCSDQEEVDVLIGGPPCQDFSIVRGPASERRGVQVQRGRLYAYFIRAMICLRPRVFVFENVPGLVSANGGTSYRTILDDFSRLHMRWDEIRPLVGNRAPAPPGGYKIVFSGVVNAADLGVPQSRRRLIIIGVRSDLLEELGKLDAARKKVSAVLSGSGHIFKRYPLTAIEAFEGRPLPDLSEEYVRIMKEYEGVAEQVGTARALRWKEKVWSKLKFDAVQDYLDIWGAGEHRRDDVEKIFREHEEVLRELGYYGRRVEGMHCPDGSNNQADESERVLERLQLIPPDENHEFLRGTEWEVEGRGMSLIYRRLHPLKPAYTVVAFGGGGTWGYHYRRSRGRLTNRERARLQTFPDSYLFSGSGGDVRVQIGEAVPPLMSRRIAEAVEFILRMEV